MAKLANPNQVYSSIKGNIDAAAKFKEYALSGRELTSSMISNREYSSLFLLTQLKHSGQK